MDKHLMTIVSRKFAGKILRILHQSEYSSFPVPLPAHSGDAKSFRILVDFKMFSDHNECFVQYDFSKLTDSGNSIQNSCYYFKTCPISTIQSCNQLSYMLYELVFLGYHSQFASYPCSFASYSWYSCKILQPYFATTLTMHSDAVVSSIGASRMKTLKNN